MLWYGKADTSASKRSSSAVKESSDVILAGRVSWVPLLACSAPAARSRQPAVGPGDLATTLSSQEAATRWLVLGRRTRWTRPQTGRERGQSCTTRPRYR